MTGVLLAPCFLQRAVFPAHSNERPPALSAQPMACALEYPGGLRLLFKGAVPDVHDGGHDGGYWGLGGVFDEFDMSVHV